MQIAARPYFFLRARRACTSVVTMRDPDEPIGWPRATAPPFTFTLFGSSPRSAMNAIATTANASFTSKRSIWESGIPAFSAAFRAAATGAVVNHRDGALLAFDRHGRELGVEISRLVRAARALVALERVRVLRLARERVLRRAELRAGAHVDVLVWVPEAVRDHRVEKLAVAHAHAGAAL